MNTYVHLEKIKQPTQRRSLEQRSLWRIINGRWPNKELFKLVTPIF